MEVLTADTLPNLLYEFTRLLSHPPSDMPGLSYPYRFQCTRCGEQLDIEQSDVEAVSDDPDSIDALMLALEEQGWVRSSKGVRCPDCEAYA